MIERYGIEKNPRLPCYEIAFKVIGFKYFRQQNIGIGIGKLDLILKIFKLMRPSGGIFQRDVSQKGLTAFSSS